MAKRVREEGRGEEAEAEAPAAEDGATQVQAPEDRRLLRSRYLAVKSQINGTGSFHSRARVRALVPLWRFYGFFGAVSELGDSR
jgi:hypothetical protein